MAELVDKKEISRRGFLSLSAIAGVAALFNAPEIVQAAAKSSLNNSDYIRHEVMINGVKVQPENWGIELKTDVVKRTAIFNAKMSHEDALRAKIGPDMGDDIRIQITLFYPTGAAGVLTLNQKLDNWISDPEYFTVETSRETPLLFAKRTA